ncbi:MAG TPA: DinB family protein [Bryobacteraceae bacterium]|nr:DinB family protein [Bryobacteraceae bacterium]
MIYKNVGIPEAMVPTAADPQFQHLLDTYASETNKVASVWDSLEEADLDWKPHPRSSTIGEILTHQLLSERRFFGEFLGTPEPAATAVLPTQFSVAACRERTLELARPRLKFMAEQQSAWWLEPVPFFDAHRQRVWVFWRRVLHTCHHRTQITVYLRLLDRPVPATYGPTADVTWSGADPTNTVDAAGRR